MFLVAKSSSQTTSSCHSASMHIAAQSTCSGNIGVLRVVHHHAMATEPPSASADAVHHHLDPLPRQTVWSVLSNAGIAFCSAFVKILCIATISHFVIGVAGAMTNRKSIGTVKGFGPPTIENATVESSIEDRLLTACPEASKGRRGLFSQTSTP